jgi:hypothetical protein
MIVVEELMHFLEAFPEKVERLDFDEFEGLGFGHADSFVFEFDDVVFVGELGFGDPFFFVGVGTARAGAPESDFLVLNGVYKAEDDETGLGIALANVPERNDILLRVGGHLSPILVLDDFRLNKFEVLDGVGMLKVLCGISFAQKGLLILLLTQVKSCIQILMHECSDNVFDFL